MSNRLLKIHLFLFYSSVATNVVYVAGDAHSIRLVELQQNSSTNISFTPYSFLVNFFKTYTDCSYHEVGLLAMFSSLGSALMKPLVCSYSDRHANYKSCLMVAATLDGLSTFSLALVTFYPQLFFDEPQPRLVWYLVAVISFVGHICLSIVVTLSDVFVLHECLQSEAGEHFGSYRAWGQLGWAVSAIAVALADTSVQLPYLALPFLVSSLYLLIDLAFVSQLKGISPEGRVGSRCGSVASDFGASKRKTELPQPSIPSKDQAISLVSSGREQAVVVYATVDPDRLRQASKLDHGALGDEKSGNRKMFEGPDTRGSDNRISFVTQLDLLIRLSRHDRHHPVKYLIFLLLLGAFNQTHYVFYFQYFTEILRERAIISLLFTLSACIQVSSCLGETLSLLWVTRLLIDKLGRDVSFVVALLCSGSRAFLIGYLFDKLNIWIIALSEVLTGILWGIIYTLMIECASSYLSILDKLLLADSGGDSGGDSDGDGDGDETRSSFVARLEELSELHSVESVRFAIRATVQGIFSGACEGIGFAIGPFLAGLWLSAVRDDSLGMLYRDMAYGHLVALLAMALLEFAFMRLLLKSRSKIDTLVIGAGSTSSSLTS